MDYAIGDDTRLVAELLGCSMQDLSDGTGISRMTLSRWASGAVKPSERAIRDFYDYAYRKGIRLNQIKAQLHKEDAEKQRLTLLCHGAKREIEGSPSLALSKQSNDLGAGFYCGERYEQAVMFVAGYPDSSLYYFAFNPSGLRCNKYVVDQEWMLAIAWNRGKLDAYAKHPRILAARAQLESCDYAIAPIADNRMFAIIDSFIDGEITDIQCQHCLSATNLGYQYVLKTDAALKGLELREHCFLADPEKQALLLSRTEEAAIGTDKVKVARRKYRGLGHYIDELLS